MAPRVNPTLGITVHLLFFSHASSVDLGMILSLQSTQLLADFGDPLTSSAIIMSF